MAKKETKEQIIVPEKVITRDQLLKKRVEYQEQMTAVHGAIQAIDQLLAMLEEGTVKTD